MLPLSGSLSNESYKRVGGLLGGSSWTGLIVATGLIGFTRRDAREADARTFRASHRTIAVPHGNGRAGEGFANWDDQCGCQQEAHRPSMSDDERPCNEVDGSTGKNDTFGIELGDEP